MSYHDEIQQLQDGLRALEINYGPAGEPYNLAKVTALQAHCERLLAMPEAAVEALVQAAQSGVAAVEAALAPAVGYAPGFEPPDEA